VASGHIFSLKLGYTYPTSMLSTLHVQYLNVIFINRLFELIFACTVVAGLSIPLLLSEVSGIR
jgi:hypothetical protein